MTEVRNNFESHLGESQPDFKLPDFSDIAENGLYVPELERDACGVGMVANITGRSLTRLSIRHSKCWLISATEELPVPTL